MNPHLHNAADLEKIAQLEADLKTTEDLLDRQTRDTMKANARAEKLEAEVERLRNGEIFTERQFRSLEKAGWRLEEKGYPNVLFGGVMPSFKNMKARKQGVNPSGDTLGGGGRESEAPAREAPSQDGRTKVQDAATNPAARKERDDG